jgi:dihydroorotate dehydrogenase electron transfer subunit
MKRIVDFIVRDNQVLNEQTTLLVLYSNDLPKLKPGQFVNVRVDRSAATLLRRPISVHDVEPEKGLLYLLVKWVGPGTSALTRLAPKERLNCILPLGNGFPVPSSGRSLLLGGGIGVAPLLFLAKEMKRRGSEPVILIGTRTREELVRIEEYEKYGKVYYATEDGSYGEKGYPTQHSILKEPFDSLFCCGPDAMMRAVARYANSNNIDCYLSLENTMACGIGACLCCVTATVEGHKCICTEGPVFHINDLKWQI